MPVIGSTMLPLTDSATENTFHIMLLLIEHPRRRAQLKPQTKPFFPGYLHPYDFMVQACLGNSFEFLLEFNLREKNCLFFWKKYHVFFYQVMTIAWLISFSCFLGCQEAQGLMSRSIIS